MIKLIAIGVKFIGFFLGALALENKLSDGYSTYLMLYSLVSFLSFLSEMGIYYNVSNRDNSNIDLSSKLGRVLIASALSSSIGMFFLWIYQKDVVNYTTLLFMLLPIFINLSLMFRGVLIKEKITNLPAVYDAIAFGAPGFIFYFLKFEITLSQVCLVIFMIHLTICTVTYFHVCIKRAFILIPKPNFQVSKFERDMALSNVIASPLGNIDLWLLMYFVPEVSSKALLVRDLASKIPNLFFPFLQIYLYPKMVAACERSEALKEFYKNSSYILITFSVGIVLLYFLGKQSLSLLLSDLNLYFSIVLLFSFRILGSFLAPLMMYERRSDLSLIRNFAHSFSFITFGVAAHFLVLQTDTNTLYFGFITVQIVLSFFDVALVERITRTFHNPYTVINVILNIFMLFYLLIVYDF